jgi:hypothetical protein
VRVKSPVWRVRLTEEWEKMERERERDREREKRNSKSREAKKQ